MIFLILGKGAIGVAGAAGNGNVNQQNKIVGTAKIKRVSVGFQMDAQVYIEVIFFENKAEFDPFSEAKVGFGGQT